MVFDVESMRTGGVAFFDSGVGGLSVLVACQDVLGGVPVYYYGDNARAPYGNRSIIELRAYVREAFLLFEKLHVRAVVVACNTVTALLLDELRRQYTFPIIGIEPAIKPAAKRGGRVLILATKATCESKRFQNLVERTREENPNTEFLVWPCLTLAGKIEREYLQGDFRKKGVEIEQELPAVSVDAVVLGCTHYSLVKQSISNFYGVPVFDGNIGVANRLEKVVKNGAEKVDNCCPNLTKNMGGILGIDHFRGFLPLLRNLPWFLRPKNEKKRVFRLRKSLAAVTFKNSRILYFMGSGSAKNRYFYERMFGF